MISKRRRLAARIIGITLGIALGLYVGVISPMMANYKDHGSVFLAPLEGADNAAK